MPTLGSVEIIILSFADYFSNFLKLMWWPLPLRLQLLIVWSTVSTAALLPC